MQLPLMRRRELHDSERFNSSTGSHVQGVYVVATRDAYKVGVSSNLPCRLKVMDTNCPQQIQLRVFVPFWGLEHEQHLHELMKPHHVKGEWFERNEITTSIESKLRLQVVEAFDDLYPFLEVWRCGQFARPYLWELLSDTSLQVMRTWCHGPVDEVKL